MIPEIKTEIPLNNRDFAQVSPCVTGYSQTLGPTPRLINSLQASHPAQHQHLAQHTHARTVNKAKVIHKVLILRDL